MDKLPNLAQFPLPQRELVQTMLIAGTPRKQRPKGPHVGVLGTTRRRGLALHTAGHEALSLHQGPSLHASTCRLAVLWPVALFLPHLLHCSFLLPLLTVPLKGPPHCTPLCDHKAASPPLPKGSCPSPPYPGPHAHINQNIRLA